MSGAERADSSEKDATSADQDLGSATSVHPIDVELVRVLGRTAGLEIPAEDLAPLAAGLVRHAERMEALKALEISGHEPIVGFDPRWL